MFIRLLRLYVLPVFVLAMVFSSVVIASEDEGLYDEVPPENSAFIRFLHAQDGESEVPPIVNGRKRDGVKFGGIKPYGVVASGTVNLELGQGKGAFETEAGKYYTAILKNNVLTLEVVPEIENELKAQMIVHNLTERDNITLKTADGKVSVIGPIAPNSFQVREINPIKVSFAIFSGDEKFVDLIDWPLERGESYIISVAEGDEYGAVANYDRARISTE
ncbi:MAG: alginate O-acetyltransferase AlgF [Alphaproteobacteria bacterium]|nr:alginate O-acetyltransferase AlgF [Alphaproteobacteria bacterium]